MHRNPLWTGYAGEVSDLAIKNDAEPDNEVTPLAPHVWSCSIAAHRNLQPR
jgi:hypothetical protein